MTSNLAQFENTCSNSEIEITIIIIIIIIIIVIMIIIMIKKNISAYPFYMKLALRLKTI